MGSLGEILKNTRDSKGIGLEQAEEDTKIRKKYLVALEEGDYDELPGRIYAKGFLRNYAKYLGLDEEEIMMEYKLLSLPVRENQKVDLQTSINKRRAGKSANRAYLATALVALLAIVTLVAYNSFFKIAPRSGAEDKGKPPVNEQTNNGRDEKGAENEPEKTPEEGDGIKPEGQTPQEPGTVNISLNGKDQICWARVTVDGVIKFTGNINPGDSKTFSGRQIKVRLGNAGAVEVIENGRNLGIPGPMGAAVTKEFTATDV